MDKRKGWLKGSLYFGSGGFIISSLTNGLLWATVNEWIVLSPLMWDIVRILVIIAFLFLLAGVALVFKAFTLKD